MSNQIKKSQPPDEKKNRPLGKSVPSTINGSNSFAMKLNVENSHPSLTTVSSNPKTSLLPGREQEVQVCDPSTSSGQAATQLPGKEQKDQWSVARKADSSNTAWVIKNFLN